MNSDERRTIVRTLGLMTQLGLSMASCILIGVLAGRFLDRRLGTSPYLLLLFIVLGAAASFKVLYDMVIKEWRE